MLPCALNRRRIPIGDERRFFTMPNESEIIDGTGWNFRFSRQRFDRL